jgi:microcystin-dependent protein
MKDLNDKITGDTLPAIEWNEVPSELQNVIEKTGQTLSTLDLDQMGKAIAVYASGGDFYTDSGIADAYVLSAVGSKQTPPAYFNGMKVRFLPANTNTGPATVNAGTLGVKSLVRTDGAVLVAGDMQAGVPYSFQYDTVSGKFLFNGEGLPDATETLKGKIEIATAAEVRAGTDATRAVTPATMGSFMTGWIFPFPTTVAPTGFVEAKGQLLSRTTFADLWTWVQVNMRVVTEAQWAGVDSGTYSSGDLSTTFRLPELRGEFIRGWDNSRGVDSGRVVGTTQTDEFQSHNHSVTANRWIGGYTDDGGSPDQRTTEQTFNTASTGSTETRPRNVAMMFCIKV